MAYAALFFIQMLGICGKGYIMRFVNRVDAGQQLARKLVDYTGNPDVIVLGLPRGGVVLAAEVAQFLDAPMDIIVARKIGAPSNPELAVGALTAGGAIYLNKPIMQHLGITVHDLTEIIETEKQEAMRRLKLYRGDRPSLELKDKIALIVDDGIATGATMIVAIQKAQLLGAKKIVVAVPVAPPETLAEIKQQGVDEVVCLYTPANFFGIGQFYDSFAQVTDDEVIVLMHSVRNA